jgi:hypothetical protein
LPWPPGWANLWGGTHLASTTSTLLPSTASGKSDVGSDILR